MSDQASTDPRTIVPSDPFVPRRSPPAEAVTGPAKSTFKMKLFKDDFVIGYFGQSSLGYGILVDAAANAVTFEPFQFGDVTYYRNHTTGWWLSISYDWCAGFYSSWAGREPCTYDKADRRFVCSDGGQALSYSKDKGYLYFWNDYGVLQVDFDYES